METTEVRATIQHAINRVLASSGRPGCAAEDDHGLTDELGLDSLDLAVIVVELEQQLHVDPFRDEQHSVRTFGELVSLYSERVGG